VCDVCCLRVCTCVCVCVRYVLAMSWALSWSIYVSTGQHRHRNLVHNQFGSANKRYCALPHHSSTFGLTRHLPQVALLGAVVLRKWSRALGTADAPAENRFPKNEPENLILTPDTVESTKGISEMPSQR